MTHENYRKLTMFHWNSHHLHIRCSCFHATMAQVSSGKDSWLQNQKVCANWPLAEKAADSYCNSERKRLQVVTEI